jgi:hypothetical protein
MNDIKKEVRNMDENSEIPSNEILSIVEELCVEDVVATQISGITPNYADTNLIAKIGFQNPDIDYCY